jgi:hypothetical protein
VVGGKREGTSRWEKRSVRVRDRRSELGERQGAGCFWGRRKTLRMSASSGAIVAFTCHSAFSSFSPAFLVDSRRTRLSTILRHALAQGQKIFAASLSGDTLRRVSINESLGLRGAFLKKICSLSHARSYVSACHRFRPRPCMGESSSCS